MGTAASVTDKHNDRCCSSTAATPDSASTPASATTLRAPHSTISTPGASAALLGGKVLIDCTQTISETATVWPGGCPFSRSTLVDSRDKDGNGYTKQKYTLGCDCGTHVDSPSHWGQPGGKAARTISDLTMEELVAPGCVVDVRAKCIADHDYLLTVEDIKAWEARHGRVPTNALVVMKTGWGARFNDAKAYTNFDGKSGPYKPDPKLGTAGGNMHFPGFAPATAKFLRTQRQIVGIGIDTLSLDNGVSSDFGTHCEMLQHNKYQVENMNLKDVPESGLVFVVMPLKVKGGPEAEARVLAIVS